MPRYYVRAPATGEDWIVTTDPHKIHPEIIARAPVFEHARRIAACMNACADILDPVEAVPELRRVTDDCARLLPYVVAVLESEGKDSSAATARQIHNRARLAGLAFHRPPAPKE